MTPVTPPLHERSGNSAPSAADVELIEAEAWAGLQLSLPPEFGSQLGIKVMRLDGAVLLLSSGASALEINRVIGLGMCAPLTESELDAVIAEYGAAGIERFVLQWSPDAKPSCATEWLANRGFTILSRLAKVYRKVDAAPVDIALNPEITVVEIGPGDAALYESIVAAPLGVPVGLGPGIRSAVGWPGWRYYLAFHHGEPIGGAALYARGEHGWFGLGATAEHARCRGAQTALLARRIHDAAADGCVWVSADTRAETAERPNQSLRNMRRAGFAVLYDRPNYLLDRHAVTD